MIFSYITDNLAWTTSGCLYGCTQVRMMKPERFRCRSSVELERDIPKTSDKGLEKVLRSTIYSVR